MSIPTPFNPLGTLGAGVELPYVQPVMTSETTWSNTTGPGAASFGCVISGYAYAYPVWHVLKERGAAFAYVYSASPTIPITILFERPIRVVRVEIAQRFRSDGNTPNWIKLIGDGVPILTYSDDARDWGSFEYRWFECNDVGYIQQIEVYYSYNGHASQLCPLVLDAYYKP